jgi:hypothetical protein
MCNTLRAGVLALAGMTLGSPDGGKAYQCVMASPPEGGTPTSCGLAAPAAGGTSAETVAKTTLCVSCGEGNCLEPIFFVATNAAILKIMPPFYGGKTKILESDLRLNVKPAGEPCRQIY